MLIHNAGTAQLFKKMVTEDGVEMTMATNQYGPFLLTHLLIGGSIRNNLLPSFLSLNLIKRLTNGCRLVETIEAESNNHRRVPVVRLGEIKFGQRESNYQLARLSLLRLEIREYRVQFRVGATSRGFRGHRQLPPSRIDKHRYMESSPAPFLVDAQFFAQPPLENGGARGANDHTPCRLGRGERHLRQILRGLQSKQRKIKKDSS